MKKLISSTILCLLGALSLTAPVSASNTSNPAATDSKAVVVFFSRPGQNYSVGNETEGNTKIVAEIVKDVLGSDLIEIVPVKPYPVSYDETVARYKEEKASNARPPIKTDKTVGEYSLIFLGYPIWGGQLPPPVVTWLESTDLTGKTIVPFSTSGGSGLADTPRQVRNIAKGAEIKDGFTIYGRDAQNRKDYVKGTVGNWLNANGYLKNKQ